MIFMLIFAMGLVVRAELFLTLLHDTSNFFLVQIGSPPQKLYVTHSLLTSHTVFVDINCGQQPQCPRYCRDEYLKNMYCTPSCQSTITKTTCNQGLKTHFDSKYADFVFWPQNSSTFQLLNENDLYTNTLEFGKQSGKHFTEKSTFLSDGNFTANLTIQNVKMIDGLLLDVKFYKWSGGVVGLAPGDGNIVSQLYAQNLIQMPTALLVIRNDGYTGALGFGIDAQELTVCDINCSQYPTQSADHWILELEDFQLNGFNYGKKTKALLSDYDEWILLPQEFLDRLVNLRILGFYDGREVQDFAYSFPCDQPLQLNLTVDGRNLTVSKAAMMLKPIGNNTCVAFLNVLQNIITVS